jgi:glycine cleavage system pyridoxal-binding protein P
VKEMLDTVGAESLEALINTAMPKSLRRPGLMDFGEYTHGMTESDFLKHFK